MANMFNQVKQAMQMRKEAKRMQAEIEKITCEYANGGITVVVRGDFTVMSIRVEPVALTEAMAGKPDRFETMMINVVNGAIKSVKQKTQEHMAKLMKGSDLATMMGG
jgi:DNA-binding YbaB/EbfC family protein